MFDPEIDTDQHSNNSSIFSLSSKVLETIGFYPDKLDEKEYSWYHELFNCTNRITEITGIKVDDLPSKVMALALTQRFAMRDSFRGVDWPCFLGKEQSPNIVNFGLEFYNKGNYEAALHTATVLGEQYPHRPDNNLIVDSFQVYRSMLIRTPDNEADRAALMSLDPEAAIIATSYMIAKNYANGRIYKAANSSISQEMQSAYAVLNTLDPVPVDASLLLPGLYPQEVSEYIKLREATSRIKTLLNDLLAATFTPHTYNMVNAIVNGYPPEIASSMANTSHHALLVPEAKTEEYSWRYNLYEDTTTLQIDLPESPLTESCPKSIVSIFNKVLSKDKELLHEFERLLVESQVGYNEANFRHERGLYTWMERLVSFEKLLTSKHPGTDNLTTEILNRISQLEDIFRARIYMPVEDIVESTRNRDFEYLLWYKKGKANSFHKLSADFFRNKPGLLKAMLQQPYTLIPEQTGSNAFCALKLVEDRTHPHSNEPLHVEIQLIPIEDIASAWASRTGYNTSK